MDDNDIVQECLAAEEQAREGTRKSDKDIEAKFLLLCDMARLLHAEQPAEAMRVFATAAASLTCSDAEIDWELRLKGLETSVCLGAASVGCTLTDLPQESDELCNYWAYRAANAANCGEAEKAKDFVNEIWDGDAEYWGGAIRILACTSNGAWVENAIPFLQDAIESRADVEEARMPGVDYSDFYPPNDFGFRGQVDALDALAYLAARHGFCEQARGLFKSSLGSWSLDSNHNIIRGLIDAGKYEEAFKEIDALKPSFLLEIERARIHLLLGNQDKWRQSLNAAAGLMPEGKLKAGLWLEERFSAGDCSELALLATDDNPLGSIRRLSAEAGIEAMPLCNVEIIENMDEVFARADWKDSAFKSRMLRAWRKVLRRSAAEGSLPAMISSLSCPADESSIYEAVGSVFYLLYKLDRRDLVLRILDACHSLNPGFEEEWRRLC